MLTIQTKNTHDRVGIVIKLGKSRLSLGWNRYSDSVSSSTDVDQNDVKRAARAWSKIRDLTVDDSLGVRQNKIIAKIEKSPTIAEAVNTLELMAANWKG